MIIAMRCLSAGVLVASSWTNSAWIRFRILVDERREISSPLAKVNSGLGISGEERFLNVHR